jgi:NAD+ diphosphatase
MPMRAEAERPNVFAGPHVDRLKFANADADAVARAISEGSARLIPVWRSRCPVIRAPSPVACLLPFSSGPFAGIDVSELILLGDYRGFAVFTTEIEAASPPDLDDGAEFADLRLAAAILPHDEAGLVAYARAMISFRHRHRFCGSCGSPTRPERNGRVMICASESCATEFFPRVDPAVIVLVTDGDRVLLGRQPGWPKGRYSTIAGFVEPGESLEDAVRREVLEETGIETGTMSYQSSQPWPFPRSLMLGFRAEAKSVEVRLRDPELEDARWFGRAELASGAMLPFSQSIAYRLIEEWYDAAASKTLAEEAIARGWNSNR